jgi:RNA polymerase sigma factor (sigma-70 family)
MKNDLTYSTAPEKMDNPALQLFLERRKAFLNFVRSPVHDLDEAEEILQRASLKIISGANGLRDAERAEAWIYRILRNEVADYYRRRAVQSRRISDGSPEVLSKTLAANSPHESKLCPCALQELPNLHPNYFDALQSVDMHGEAIAALAQRKGISVNSATVRLHRARKSLRSRLQMRCGTCAGAGCFDCRCGQHARSQSSARQGRL